MPKNNVEMHVYDNDGFDGDKVSVSTSSSSTKSTGYYDDVEEAKKSEKEDCGLEYGVGAHAISGKGQDRPAWDNQIQFICACIAFAVGLGNFWRFPYLAQTYGGGAFLIPYLLMLVFEGIPLFLMELSIGQRLRRGPIGAWTTFHPFLVGIGIASMVVSFTVGLYYNTIVAWCFWYICNSFTDPLPYATCPLNANRTGYDEVCLQTGSTEFFWYRETLNISDSLDESGGMVWWIVVCLILAWFCLWVGMVKGIESSGKVMYFTATFPYLVLFIFLVRGLTLKGSTDGLSYLFTPDLNTLADPNVWLDAATQIFFSLGLGFGGVIAFSSYNPKKQDCQRDALIIALTNSCTSVLASLVIFSVLGYKATLQYERCVINNIAIVNDFEDNPEGSITIDGYHDYISVLNQTEPEFVKTLKFCSVEEILDEKSQGTGLAFVVFTEAIISMPGSPVWSVLFFLMLLSLGMGSMFGTIEGVITPLFDLGLKVPRSLITGLLAVVSCCIGLMFCQQSGNYWLEIFDGYAGSIPLLIIAFCEITTVSWFYGTKNFDEDVAWMYGGPKSVMGWILHWYFRLCWTFISPVVILTVFVAYVYTTASSSITYDQWVDGEIIEGVKYPWFGTMVIVILIVLPLIFIPLMWIYGVIKTKRSGKKNVGILCRKWTLNHIKFWQNKYDKHGNLIK